MGRVDLRKIAGKLNPAVLFTKHSLRQLRLEQLVALHGCKYLGGRAESAPLTRTGVSSRATLVSADTEVGAAAGNSKNPLGTPDVDDSGTLHGSGSLPEEHPNLGSGSHTMPHLDLNADNLDIIYPPLEAPADDRLEDLVGDHDDSVF